MFMVFIICLLIIVGTILWMKKLQWQSSNPFAYVILLGTIGLTGVMLVPNLPDILVPNLLEDWAYTEAYADGPGGASHMLFIGTIIALMIVGGIVSRLALNWVTGKKSSIAYIAIFAILVVFISGSIGMNLRGMNVDVAEIVGKEAAPVAQQAMASTMNATGTLLNKMSEGMRADRVYAPQYVVDRAPSRFEQKKVEPMPSFQPWTLKPRDENNGTDTPSRSNNNSSSYEEEYNPADYEPAQDQQPSRYESTHESTSDYWEEVKNDQAPKKESKKTDRARPLRYGSGPGND